MKKIIIEKETLIDLYVDKQLSQKKISILMGCSIPTIIKLMKVYNIEKRNKPIIIEPEILMGLYIGLNYSSIKISEMFGCSPSYISKLLIFYNIPIRHSGWQVSGENHPLSGKHLSNAHKEKISIANTGRLQSKEEIKKRVESRNGYRHTKETKEKIRNSQPYKGKHIQTNTGRTHFEIGHLPWNLGVPTNNKTKEKISKSNTGKLKGDKCYFWKGGVTEENHGIRAANYAKEKRWRKKIYKRDNYTCQLCCQCGGDLNAHHILSWIDYPQERYNVDNGITLCKGCHLKVHKIQREYNWSD